MNISRALMVKGAFGLGVAGTSVAGIVFLGSGGSKSNPIVFSDNDFSKKAEEIMKKVGIDSGWCKRNSEKKYVCEKSISADNLKKIKFANKYSNEEYMVNDSYPNIEMEILETKDKVTFPNGIKFVTKNTNTNISIVKKNSGGKKDWTYEIKVATKGEFKFDESKNGLVWAWQEINDLTGKVGLKCIENNGTCSIIDGQKINIKDGEKTVEGVTLKSEKGWEFKRLIANFFQGYKFIPKEDIEVKYDEGITEDEKKIKKLEINKPYQITRDVEDETKWYLTVFKS